MCTGYAEGSVIDACQGDSGGPFACLYNGVYVLDGIVSTGPDTFCGQRNSNNDEKAGFYTRVGDKLILDWVKSKIEDPLPTTATSTKNAVTKAAIEHVKPAEIKSLNCYAKNVDIDNSWTGSNIVDELTNFKSAASCQQKCAQRKNEGCEYFVYQEATKECSLYNNLNNIEYDDDKDEENVMGLAEGCLPCYRHGWDYIKTGSGHNLVSYRAIHGVTKALSCAKICNLVPSCHYWRLLFVT